MRARRHDRRHRQMQNRSPYTPSIAQTAVIIASYLVGRVARVSAPAHEGKQVAPEKHLHNSDASVTENPSKGLSERIHVVDAETVIRPARETSCTMKYKAWKSTKQKSWGEMPASFARCTTECCTPSDIKQPRTTRVYEREKRPTHE